MSYHSPSLNCNIELQYSKSSRNCDLLRSIYTYIIYIHVFPVEPSQCCLTVCHAELNAIMNKNSTDVKGCTIYVTLFPCNECAKLIVQAGGCWHTHTNTHTQYFSFNCLTPPLCPGIKEVVYLSDKYHEREYSKASRILLDNTGIKYRWETYKFAKNLTNICAGLEL